ncbi:MAG: glycosyl hydrolase, partial [candidate division Zixibacteria bacterium]|nr:glycosyl hydrolase [candidate division Zixibacteria bacterium]
NIDMVSGIYIKELPDLVRSEQLSESIVDVAVRPVLEAKYKLGLFDDPFRYHDVDRERGRIYTEGHLSFAREIARESIVLLKNKKQLLPLRKDISTMAIIGALAKDQDAPLGSWRGAGRSDDVVTVWEGIQKAVSSQTKLMYADGYNLQNFDDDSGFDEALEVARQADVVVLVLGETAWMSGEASNRSQISLPGKQEALAKAIQATGKPIIAVLMNGRPLAISWLADNIPAILET